MATIAAIANAIDGHLGEVTIRAGGTVSGPEAATGASASAPLARSAGAMPVCGAPPRLDAARAGRGCDAGATCRGDGGDAWSAPIDGSTMTLFCSDSFAARAPFELGDAALAVGALGGIGPDEIGFSLGVGVGGGVGEGGGASRFDTGDSARRGSGVGSGGGVA
jgi:hypothetical protein